MSSKEIKTRLKAAKAAVEEKDFDKALKQCQMLFLLDALNYNGRVFAGLACLQLGQYEDSKTHYKTAIEQQPDGPLAWKGLADYYDKHRAVIQDEQLDAIKTYTKLLGFIDSNTAKKRATLHKLIPLHKEFNRHDEVFRCYSELVNTMETSGEGEEPVAKQQDDDEAAVQKICIETTSYLLDRKELSDEAWAMLEKTFRRIAENYEQKPTLREKFTKKLFSKFMSSQLLDIKEKKLLEDECSALVSTHPNVALPILVHIGLMDIVTSLREDWERSPPTLPDQQKEWFTHYHSLIKADTQGEGEDKKKTSFKARDISFGWAGLSAVQVSQGKWKEAKDSASKAVEQSDVPSECWLLSAYICLRFHDYIASETAAKKGIATLPKSAKFIKKELDSSLKLLLCKACLGAREKEHVQEAVDTLMELAQVESCDYHVTVSLFKACILQGDLDKASEILQRIIDSSRGDHFQALILRAELQLAKADHAAALSSIDSALSLEPSSSQCLFLKGSILWKSHDTNKKPAYATLVQAAKADPYNPDVFLLLGHYQREISKDLKRAVKCCQKVLDLLPANTEAAMCLGEVLTADGNEDEAFEVYSKVVSCVPVPSAKLAWLRMGLHQRKKEKYTEAIHSFQNTLSADPNDLNCWECLGEAYLARGSYNSALRTFTKVLETNPDSQYSIYQIACIKLILGEANEAFVGYSAVLEKEPSFVPALKGRAECHLLLSRQALQSNFDGKAVDLISLALQDLVRAVQIKPHFVSLWKLIGDSLISLHVLAADIARPSVPKVLCGQSPSSPDDRQVVDKKEAIFIGCRAYAKGLQFRPESAHLWHDLGVAYLYLGQATEKGDPEREKYFTNALNTVKKAVSLSSKNHQLWTSLGVIAATPEINSPSLAQHAFIRSLQEEKYNATAWSNLGALYLKHDNLKLAHEAFKNAQAIAPDCVEAWIGQAIIAESIGDDETMDLFRHSTDLGYHPEGSAGYGYWVCNTLATIDPKLILIPGQGTLNSVALTEMLQARDCLQKRALRERDDSCSLNYLGILYEKEGLLEEARKAYSSALKVATSADKKAVCMIKVNYARVLSAQGKQSEALKYLQSLAQEGEIDVGFDLALALYRSLKYTESGREYQQLFEKHSSCKEDESDSTRSNILCAQAMVAFAQGNHDGCKQYLFKAFQTPPVSAHGLVALCVLGCLTSNLTLIQAALMEIEKIIGDWMNDVPHPSCTDVLNVVLFLLHGNPQADECVQTLKGILVKLPSTSSNHQMPLPLPLMLHTLSSSCSDEDKVSTRLASVQKLVHTHPNDVWSLATLTSLLEKQPLLDLKTNYQQLVLLHVEEELKELSEREVQSGVEKNYQSTLTSLKQWVLAVN